MLMFIGVAALVLLGFAAGVAVGALLMAADLRRTQRVDIATVAAASLDAQLHKLIGLNAAQVTERLVEGARYRSTLERVGRIWTSYRAALGLLAFRGRYQEAREEIAAAEAELDKMFAVKLPAAPESGVRLRDGVETREVANG